MPPPANDQGAVSGSYTQAQVTDKTSETIPGQYIVVFEDQAEGVISEQAAEAAVQRTQSVLSDNRVSRDSVMFQYKYALKGFSAKLSKEQVEKLKRDPRVKRISQARMFTVGIAGTNLTKDAEKKPSRTTMQSGQTTPWGVNRVNGPLDGTGETAWILDTGIDLDHADLNVDVVNSVSFIANETADDQVGHGTHVAGIVAAEDNSQDVVGVAAGASVISIKVCDQNGECPEPQLLNGIDYVGNQAAPDDIVNMSIGGPGDQDIDDAVTVAANNGVRLVIAAGNDADNANNFSPGRVNHPNVWTVSAYREGDEFAQQFDCGPYCNAGSNFSNPPIEYSGPGEDVPSLNTGGGWDMGFDPNRTGDEDGTSYAAPHIAGLLLAAPQDLIADGTVSNDPDANADPIAFNEPPAEVVISGPGSLLDGQQGTWSASVEYGSGSYSYQWYYKNPGSSNWFPGGSSSSFSRTFYNTSSTAVPAYVKVEATNGSQQLVDEYTVLISGSSGGGGCPPGYICS